MNLPDLPPDFCEKIAGPLGSAISMLFMRETWVRRLLMALAACPLSWYGAPHLAQWLPIKEGFAGLLLGLFGMAVVAKLYAEWQDFQIVAFIRERWPALKKD